MTGLNPALLPLSTQASPPERRRISDAALHRLVAQMRHEPHAEFHTETAAAALGVPSFAFIRAFKALTGLSPQRFHAALRIERAKCLLVETERSVTDISLEAGYNSLGTFIRTFTAMVGVSPRQLRRLARGDMAAIGQLGNFVASARAEALLHAVVEPPLPAHTLVAAGLFPQSLPAGLPFDGCFVDPADPRFSLAWPPGGHRASLLVAAVGAFELPDAWAGRMAGTYVCSLALPSHWRGTQSAPLMLRLRPLADTDPPFLTPVPLLMLVQSKRLHLAGRF